MNTTPTSNELNASQIQEKDRVPVANCANDAALNATMALCGESTGEAITRSLFDRSRSGANNYSSTADCNEVREVSRLGEEDLLELAGFGRKRFGLKYLTYGTFLSLFAMTLIF